MILHEITCDGFPYCNIFRLKSAKVEILSESGREFHNLAAKYQTEDRPVVEHRVNILL